MKDKLNWREVWEEMQKQRMRPLKITFDPEFRAKFAEDYSEMAKYKNYEYGRKATEALSEILDKNFEVLEIGAGPGTLTKIFSKLGFRRLLSAGDCNEQNKIKLIIDTD